MRELYYVIVKFCKMTYEEEKRSEFPPPSSNDCQGQWAKINSISGMEYQTNLNAIRVKVSVTK